MTNEQRIAGVISKITSFENYKEVARARKELSDISGAEVINWISEASKHWSGYEIIGGEKLENLEEVFEAQFELKRLIEIFFEDIDVWIRWMPSRSMVDRFNQETGRNITMDDVVRNIGMDFITYEFLFHYSIIDLFECIEESGGDVRLLLNRIALFADRLRSWDIGYLAFVANRVGIDSPAANKLAQCVDWEMVKRYGDTEDVISFLKRFTPHLAPQVA